VNEAADELQRWARVKREHALSDAQVQMARELGINPRRVLEPDKAGQEPLARRIETLYLKRFKKPLPDSVVPLRQALHDARARERAEARERRLRKRQAEKDHAEAARISLLTLRRICNAIGLGYVGDLSQPDGDDTQDSIGPRGLP